VINLHRRWRKHGYRVSRLVEEPIERYQDRRSILIDFEGDLFIWPSGDEMEGVARAFGALAE
jgi:hypothetical protein